MSMVIASTISKISQSAEGYKNRLYTLSLLICIDH